MLCVSVCAHVCFKRVMVGGLSDRRDEGERYLPPFLPDGACLRLRELQTWRQKAIIRAQVGQLKGLKGFGDP